MQPPTAGCSGAGEIECQHPTHSSASLNADGRRHMFRSVVRFIAIYVVLSGLIGALALLQLWPWQPKTAVGWLVLFVCALPITAAGEWLGQLAFENRFATSLGNGTAPDSLSWLRVAYGVVVVLVLTAIAVAIVVGVTKVYS